MSSVKEPHFFAFKANRELVGNLYADEEAAAQFYRSLFERAPCVAAIGDASNSSLCVPGTAAQINADHPNAKIIAILRHPVERAYSHFRHFLDAGAETTVDFEYAINQEEQRLREGWPFTYGYKQWGFYYSQLQPYYDIFPRQRIQIHLYEDYVADPLRILQRIFAFLEVDPSFVPDVQEKLNVSRMPDKRVLYNVVAGQHRYLKAALRRLPVRQIRQGIENLVAQRARGKLTLKPRTRTRLIKEFSSDIEKLQTLIGRDLSGWQR